MLRMHWPWQWSLHEWSFTSVQKHTLMYQAQRQSPTHQFYSVLMWVTIWEGYSAFYCYENLSFYKKLYLFLPHLVVLWLGIALPTVTYWNHAGWWNNSALGLCSVRISTSSGFSQSLQTGTGIVQWNKPWPLPSMYLPTLHSQSSSHVILSYKV
jgi:hypothetical protein